MIFRLAYENCGLNPAKPDFTAGYGFVQVTGFEHDSQHCAGVLFLRAL